MKRLLQASAKGKLPDLSRFDDMAEWVLGAQAAPGEASDSEPEEEVSRVTLPQRMPGRGNHAAQRSAVKLAEIGPRVTFKLFKVTQAPWVEENEWRCWRRMKRRHGGRKGG